jgi:hypothetical protein
VHTGKGWAASGLLTLDSRSGTLSSALESSQKGVLCALTFSDLITSQYGSSPTLFATSRADRVTFLLQGWVVTDPEALADVGEIPPGEGLVEVPIEVLRLAAQHERWAES